MSEASSAPQQLADHLGLHANDDAKDIMKCLARLRAQACLDALVAEGVPASQLSVGVTEMAATEMFSRSW